ncbi:hypothetical protein NKH18_29010 [Streptomyces sp. M10(2022)]
MVHAGPTEDGGFRLAGVLPYTSQGDGFPSPPPDDTTTTFVAPTDDFRAQSSAGSRVRVIQSSTGTVSEGVGQSNEQDQEGSGIAIGCGVAALIGVLLVIGLVVGGYFLVHEADKAMIEPEQFDAVTVGQSEAEVREQLPNGDSFMKSEPGKSAPPEPKGSTCLTLLSTEIGNNWDADPVFRFCFKDDKLVEKKAYENES